MSVILEHYESCFIFACEKPIEVNVESLLNMISNSLKKYDNNTTEKTLNLFNFFKNTNKNILFPENLDTSIHLINLMWIVEDKKHFPIALRYIEKRIGVVTFTEIYELLSSSEKMFSILISILIKYSMTGVLKEEKIKNIISQIYLIDDLIVNKMKNTLRDINYKSVF